MVQYKLAEETVTISIAILSCDPLVSRMNQQLQPMYQQNKSHKPLDRTAERQWTSSESPCDLVLTLRRSRYQPLLFTLGLPFSQDGEEEGVETGVGWRLGGGGWGETALGGKITAHTLGHE